jgi:hypothetical protein
MTGPPPRPSLPPPSPAVRASAVAVLAAFGVAVAWGLVATSGMARWSLGMPALADLDLYGRVVDRDHRGEGYYDVLGELIGGRQPVTRSMFNWRQPTYAWLLGALPDPALGRWVLMGLALASVALTARYLLEPHCGRVATVCGLVLLLGGTFGWAVHEPDGYLSTETWCEPLILLSLVAYARGRWPAGVAGGAAALALRELALPYCLAASALAAARGRRAEVLTWVFILCAYAASMVAHGREVERRNSGIRPLSVEQWKEPGGLRFVIRTGSMNMFLRPLPPAALAVYLPLAMVGLGTWPGDTGVRLAVTAGVYAAAFALVTGTDYWGSLYTPILVLGLLRSPRAICGLCAEVGARRPPSPGATQPR